MRSAIINSQLSQYETVNTTTQTDLSELLGILFQIGIDLRQEPLRSSIERLQRAVKTFDDLIPCRIKKKPPWAQRPDDGSTDYQYTGPIISDSATGATTKGQPSDYKRFFKWKRLFRDSMERSLTTTGDSHASEPDFWNRFRERERRRRHRKHAKVFKNGTYPPKPHKRRSDTA